MGGCCSKTNNIYKVSKSIVIFLEPIRRTQIIYKHSNFKGKVQEYLQKHNNSEQHNLKYYSIQQVKVEFGNNK